MFFKRLIKNKLTVVGAVLITLMALMAILSPWLTTHDPYKMDFKQRLNPPSQDHFLGTDEYGRDVYSRIVLGSTVAMRVGFFSVSLSLILGVLLGLFSGYYGGWTDSIIMRIMDAVVTFPTLLLAIGIMAVLGPGLINLMIAIGVVYTPRFARVVRSSVLSIREKEYIEAARVTGCNNFSIIFQHILPNCWPPVIILSTINFGYAILWEAALSYLGLGAPPPTPSWGSVLSEGKDFMVIAPWLTTFPGIAIAFVVLGLNLFGDGLRDVLDPRLKE